MDIEAIAPEPPERLVICTSSGSHMVAVALGAFMGMGAAVMLGFAIHQGGPFGWVFGVFAATFMLVFWGIAIWSWRTRNNRLEVLRIEREGLIAHPTRERWTIALPWASVRRARVVRHSSQIVLAIEPVDLDAEMSRFSATTRALIRLQQLITASSGVVFLPAQLEMPLDELAALISERVSATNTE
jgi:hypothetical protein